MSQSRSQAGQKDSRNYYKPEHSDMKSSPKEMKKKSKTPWFCLRKVPILHTILEPSSANNAATRMFRSVSSVISWRSRSFWPFKVAPTLQWTICMAVSRLVLLIRISKLNTLFLKPSKTSFPWPTKSKKWKKTTRRARDVLLSNLRLAANSRTISISSMTQRAIFSHIQMNQRPKWPK